MENQLIPAQHNEYVHQLMNYISSFQTDLQMNEYITAEEFYVALENMNKNEKYDMLINYIAATFVQAIFRDIKNKNKHQSYLLYEDDKKTFKSMRTCFKRIEENTKTFMQMWREFLVFFFQIKSFRKQYLIENYNASASMSRRRTGDDEDEESEDEDEEQSRNSEQNSKRNSNGGKDSSENSDIEDDESNENEEKSQSKKKLKDISPEDQLYEYYYCRSITDTDTQFADFSTSEKLQAFVVLVKIGYKLPFCQQFFSNRFKNNAKIDDSKLKNELNEKIEEQQENLKLFEESNQIIQKYCDSVEDDLKLLSQEDMKEYRKEKYKNTSLKNKLDRLEKNIQNQSAEIKLIKRKQYFQYNNWVLLGKDKDKNFFFACAYELSLIFKKTLKGLENDDLTSQNIECNLYQFDNLTNLKSELNLKNISDDQLWDKINTLNNDGILTVPEVKPQIKNEDNGSDRKSNTSYYQAKTKLIKENLLGRDYCFIQQPKVNPFSSVSNNKKKSATSKLAIEDLDAFSFNKRVTRGSVGDKKKRTLIIDDSEEEDDDDYEDY